MCEEQSNLPRKGWRKKMSLHLQNFWSRVKIVTTSWSLYDNVDYEDLWHTYPVPHRSLHRSQVVFLRRKHVSSILSMPPPLEMYFPGQGPRCIGLALSDLINHWRYGYRDDDGEDLRPLIKWHHTTHDQDLYQDFQDLAGLVAAL